MSRWLFPSAYIPISPSKEQSACWLCASVSSSAPAPEEIAMWVTELREMKTFAIISAKPLGINSSQHLLSTISPLCRQGNRLGWEGLAEVAPRFSAAWQAFLAHLPGPFLQDQAQVPSSKL